MPRQIPPEFREYRDSFSSRSSFYRHMRRVQELRAGNIKMGDLRGTSLRTPSEQEALAMLPVRDQQRLIALAKAGRAVSAKRRLRATPITAEEMRRGVNKLVSALKSAQPEVRAEFIARLIDHVAAQAQK